MRRLSKKLERKPSRGDNFYSVLLYLLPLVLFFSYHPVISLGGDGTMNFELSLPIIWLVVFDVFGAERLSQFAIKAGEELIVSFDIDAHEYQGRWFNSIRAWNVQRVDAAAAQAAAPVAAAPVAPAPAPADGANAPFPAQSEGESADDLPF